MKHEAKNDRRYEQENPMPHSFGRPWKLSELRPGLREQVMRRLAAAGVVARCGDPESEPDQGAPLGAGGPDTPVLVDHAGPVLVRFTRVGGRGLDGDNLQGGCKQLRDAVAAALGRRGDSDADGMRWEYRQRPARFGEAAGTVIEIFGVGV
jgi:hypothetical protein